MFYRWLARLALGLRVREILIDGQPYLRRYYLGRLAGFTFYLHHFLAPDPDQGLHDHPWRQGFAMPLTGGYLEERLNFLDVRKGPVTYYRARLPFMPYRLTFRDFHRIVALLDFDAWSLFVHSDRFRLWGFLNHDAIAGVTHYAQPFAHEWDGTADDWTKRPRGRDLFAGVRHASGN